MVESNEKSNGSMAHFDSDTGREAGEKSSRKGVPNKDNARREWISQFLDDYTNEKLKEDFYSVSPGERLKIAVKLMEYDTAKLRSVELFNSETPEKEVGVFKIGGQTIFFQ